MALAMGEDPLRGQADTYSIIGYRATRQTPTKYLPFVMLHGMGTRQIRNTSDCDAELSDKSEVTQQHCLVLLYSQPSGTKASTGPK